MENPDDAGTKAKSNPARVADVLKICKSLNDNDVNYVLVGGWAVNIHGYSRATMDIDLLVDDSVENVKKIKKALSILEDNAVADIADTDIQKFTVVRIADEVLVDLMGRIGDVTTKTANIIEREVDGIKIRIADLETMIKTKGGYRSKDKEDLQFLLHKKAESNKKDAPKRRKRFLLF